ncbi:MAG: CDP-alcohol phosphatidyltransferase family protein [Clostridiales bacterium]|nr:CDP-alcohol phosphatidyltransferase family protein [Clostridiales bacterium]
MANAITCIRIACSLGLILCPTFSPWFYVLYIAGGISDVLDGAVARHLGKETKIGARLDTVADVIFVSIMIVKLFLTVVFPTWILIWTAFIAVVKCINVLIGFVRHHRFVAEHTVMNRISGVLLFAIPLCEGWFSSGLAFVLIILTCGIATFAAIQEGYYICIGKEICWKDFGVGMRK